MIWPISHTRKGARRRWRGPRRNGAVAVESAILLPVFFLFLLGLIDFSRAIWTQAVLNYAVQSAARCAAVDATRCATLAQVQSYAVSKAIGIAVSASAFTVTAASCGIKVTASKAFTFTTPFVYSSGLTLTATACYPS